ncbi:MAG: RluA family pseudouridine synthase [Burkholderiaceae bacterium]|jgi:23S rRNA pseudouridine955/2504/2580 synthase|uniref:RluA family pseudouridine synthase n=1 Tax=Polynucleobacter sp. MWH-Loch1C5 TaxID=2689108 RepID=UPI001C0B3428|nr:RluA family pseudouridine synthase [Polynucleobacter sp. MWH-Loch1C5]MBU3541983.1 RluA family pseudouridine synthase [Polynucleobacter sp. MWH-Loch1C5]NBV00317.1 RluA family pseudouridine synthase [Burkholderiaceae bacterium]
MDSNSVSQHIVLFEEAGQRLDNFLFRIAKGVPKTHIYRVIRSGEVRVNKKRADASQKLVEGDVLRIPPMRVAESTQAQSSYLSRKISEDIQILHEDEHLIVVNKPSGVAVHGGSGVSLGVIEAMRAQRPQAKFLELVHRLDRDTSGLLLLAKKRSALVHLHEQIRLGAVDKRYWAVVHGEFSPDSRAKSIKFPLLKFNLPNGERRVRVSAEGQASHTIVKSLRTDEQKSWTLVEAQLKTGRTHQIRVHLQHSGHPILGDDKYGDVALDKILRPKRLMLHAHRIVFLHPAREEKMMFIAKAPAEFSGYSVE